MNGSNFVAGRRWQCEGAGCQEWLTRVYDFLIQLAGAINPGAPGATISQNIAELMKMQIGLREMWPLGSVAPSAPVTVFFDLESTPNLELKSFNPDGGPPIITVIPSPQHGIKRGIHAFGGGLTEIHLERRNLSAGSLSAPDHEGIFTFAHELWHTTQPLWDGSSIWGEVEAYNLETGLMREFGVPIPHWRFLLSLYGFPPSRNKCDMCAAHKILGSRDAAYRNKLVIVWDGLPVFQTDCDACPTPFEPKIGPK